MFKDLVIDGCAGSYHFSNTSFYNSLSHLWIFKLVTDSHTVTGFYQFMQIGVERMSPQTSAT